MESARVGADSRLWTSGSSGPMAPSATCGPRAVVEKRAKGAPRRLLGGVQDITDQRHAEREMAAHLAVSEALSVWSSLEAGRRAPAARPLHRAGLLGGDPLASAGRRPGGAPVLSTWWEASLPSSSAPPGSSVFEGHGSPGAGLGTPGARGRRAPDRGDPLRPGRGRRSRRSDLRARDPRPHRRGGAGRYSSYVARDDAELTDRLMRLLTGVGYELGAFLGHRRGELKPPLLTDRQLEVLQLAARGESGPGDRGAALHQSRDGQDSLRAHLREPRRLRQGRGRCPGPARRLDRVAASVVVEAVRPIFRTTPRSADPPGRTSVDSDGMSSRSRATGQEIFGSKCRRLLILAITAFAVLVPSGVAFAAPRSSAPAPQSAGLHRHRLAHSSQKAGTPAKCTLRGPRGRRGRRGVRGVAGKTGAAGEGTAQSGVVA